MTEFKMPTNQAFIKMAGDLVRRQNIQLLKIIAENEDLDYDVLVDKYIEKKKKTKKTSE